MPSRDAIVVLGCRNEPEIPVGALLRRAQRAAEAWHRGLARQVVVCGGTRWAGRSEATSLTHALIRAGVPPGSIHAEHCSLTTFENVWYAAEVLQELQATRLFVVTCDFHIPRALKLFRQAGFDCVGLAAATPESRPQLRRQLSELASTFLQPAIKQLAPRMVGLLSTPEPKLLARGSWRRRRD